MGVRAGPAGPSAAGPMFTAVNIFIHDKTTTSDAPVYPRFDRGCWESGERNSAAWNYCLHRSIVPSVSSAHIFTLYISYMTPLTVTRSCSITLVLVLVECE